MGINATVTRNGDGSWTFTWPVGTSPYSIWFDGELQTSTLTTESYTISDPAYDATPPPLEILNSGDTSQSQENPPRAIVQWRGLTGATEYGIEKLDGSWTEQAQQSEDGSGYYSWTSDAETDVTTVQYRVTAYSPPGASGTPLTFSVFICRNPAPPSVALSIDSSGDLVVASG